MQFTNVLDFMILMPLAPQLMRLFEIDPRHFGFLVSAYTFAAAASGFVAAFWIDRFGRKRALLDDVRGIHRRDRAVRRRAQLRAPARGAHRRRHLRRRDRRAGVHDRRRRRSVRAPRARHGLVAAAFSLAAVMGVPLGLWFAAHYSWRAPFLALAASACASGRRLARACPRSTRIVAGGERRRPLAQLRADIRRAPITCARSRS